MIRSQPCLLSILSILVMIVAVNSVMPDSRFTTKKFKLINGLRMAYVEVGTGDPIVFLHGNPTSSYLWRNIMPHLEGKGRLIAPDMIGMGDSDKIPPGDPSRYTVLQHANFLFQLFEALGVKKRITFVIHDWGSAIGFLWACLNQFNPDAVRGIAFMEALVAPLSTGTFTLDESFAPFINRLRTPAGEKLILQDNIFVKQLFPAGIIRNLTKAEMQEYERPFVNAGEDRRPTLTFPRQIPIDGAPDSTALFIGQYAQYIPNAKFPKLFIRAIPGVLITNGPVLDFVRTWNNLTEVSVSGIHYVQEDAPDEIGRAIAAWLPK